MSKIGFLVWVVLAPTLAGIFILVLLLTPSLLEDEMKWMLPAALAGAVVAVPFSWLIAKKMASIGL